MENKTKNNKIRSVFEFLEVASLIGVFVGILMIIASVIAVALGEDINMMKVVINYSFLTSLVSSIICSLSAIILERIKE